MRNLLKAAVDDLLNNRKILVEEAIDKHFSIDFQQRTNGIQDDRSTIISRIKSLRETFVHAIITVLDEHIDNERYAERHIIELIKQNGERIHQEVYVFAQLDTEKRFTLIEEMTLAIKD